MYGASVPYYETLVATLGVVMRMRGYRRCCEVVRLRREDLPVGVGPARCLLLTCMNVRLFLFCFFFVYLSCSEATVLRRVIR